MTLPIALDRRVTESSSGVSVAFDGTYTTWTIPYEVPTDGSAGDLVVVRESTRGALTTTRPTATTIRATGNFLGVPVHIGVSFLYCLQFSLLYRRDPQTGRPDIRGRTNLRYVKIHYEQATHFTVTVSSQGRADRTYTFTAASLASPESGIFSVPIQSQNVETSITITAESAGAAGFSGYEWEGLHYQRTRSG